MLEAHEAVEVMISVRLHRGGTNANRTFELLLTISPVDSMIGVINSLLNEEREACNWHVNRVRKRDWTKFFASWTMISRPSIILLFPGFLFRQESRFRFKSQFASFVNTVYREVRLPKIILNDDEKSPTYPKEQEEGEKE